MTARLVRYADLAPEIRHFVFEVPQVETVSFQPGQFVSLVAEIDGKPITRAYSIAAPQSGTNRFEICLNRVQDGVLSPRLFTLEPGAEVEFRGVFGAFGWRQPVPDCVLVATGTGIVPFRAMLLGLPPEGPDNTVTLIYGTRYAENLLYADEFRAMAERWPKFKFVPTVTRPKESWSGATGRVQPLLLEALGERHDMQVYICGLKEMVDDLRRICKERGMDRRQIVYEKYD